MFKIELFICIKIDLVLNNLQWLICHKKPNQIKPNHVVSYSGPHLTPLQLLGREGGAPLPYEHSLVAFVTLCLCDCLWLCDEPLLLWLPTYMISQRLLVFGDPLPSRVSCLHPHIAVFLFTQLEHDGSVKGQYAILEIWVKM